MSIYPFLIMEQPVLSHVFLVSAIAKPHLKFYLSKHEARRQYSPAIEYEIPNLHALLNASLKYRQYASSERRQGAQNNCATAPCTSSFTYTFNISVIIAGPPFYFGGAIGLTVLEFDV